MVAPSPCRQRRHDRGGPQGGDLDARGRPEGPHSSRADVGHCSARLVESAPNRPYDGHGTHRFGPGTSRSTSLARMCPTWVLMVASDTLVANHGPSDCGSACGHFMRYLRMQVAVEK